MTKLKLPIIIAIVAIAGIAGLLLSGVVGGGPKGPVKKHAIEPVPLTAPTGSFLVNLKDPDCSCFLKLNVALKLDPMADAEWAGWSGANAGGHGGAGEAPGPAALAKYAKFHDAINRVVGGFSSTELLADGGQKILQDELLKEFATIAEVDEAEHKSTFLDEAHIGVGPPYHVAEVLFTEFVVSS